MVLKARSAVPPYSFITIGLSPKFRDRNTKLLLRKNIARKLKDIERKVTFMPDLSG